MRSAASDSSAVRAQHGWRWVLFAGTYLAGFVLLDLAIKSVERFPGVAAFFPSDGLALALVYVVGIRMAPVVFVGYAISTCLVHGFGDVPLMLGASAVGTGLQLATVALLRWARVDLARAGVRDMVRFVAAVVAASLAGAVTIAGTLVLSEELPAAAAKGAFFTAATGLAIGLIVAAPLGAMAGPRVRAWLAGHPAGPPLVGDRAGWVQLGRDAALLLATTAIAVLVAFSARAQPADPLYLCFLPIIWMALRRGLPGAAVATLVVDTAVVIAFRAADLPPPDLDKIQLLQAAMSLTGLLLGAVVSEREVAQAEAREAEVMRRQLELARRIQTGVLPALTPLPGFEVAGSMLPASHVGGDFYDIVRLDEGDPRFWILIGDVSGHGLDAGLVMLMAQAAAQAALRARADLTPRQLVSQVNRVLYENIRLRMKHKGFMTFLALHHQGDGRFRAAGGHLPVFLVGPGGRAETVEAVGPWCGIRPDIAGQLQEVELLLGPGDTLCLVTDGIVEARSSAGELFGEERLLARLGGAAHLAAGEALREVLVGVRDFQARQEDDMTAVLLRRASAADAGAH
jgi:serine phosphatase RsbU (regulator of sigma subunit)